MQFFLFHLMPWPTYPANFDRDYSSGTVTFPNSYYEPEQAPALYDRYLSEFELADRLGFDALGISEHHATPSSLSPAPNLFAAALAQRTSRAKIAILGNAIAVRDNPLRVAEELAMLDAMSGGRLISGFIRGLGSEYFATNVNPTYSHERFVEAHDLIVRAWTEPGPFSFHGKHYRYKYVNIWPKPVQQPHPPIYIPSGGDASTTAWAVANRYTFMRSFAPVAAIKPSLDNYRERAREIGYEPSPEQLGWMAPIYVAETDALAVAEAKPQLDFFFNVQHKRPITFRIPPSYAVETSMGRGLKPSNAQHAAPRSFESMLDVGMAVVGSPATVRQRLTEHCTNLGVGNFTGLFHFGVLSHELTVKSLQLFASEVMPYLRDLNAPTARRPQPTAP